MKLTKIHDLSFEELKDKLQSVVIRLDQEGFYNDTFREIKSFAPACEPCDGEDRAGCVPHACLLQFQVRLIPWQMFV